MNIVTTAEAEKHLQLQSGAGGDYLTHAVALVSAKLARFTGRDDWGPSEERTEYHDGGSAFIFPRIWPVTSFTIYDDTDHVWASDTVLDSDEFYATENGLIVSESGRLTEGLRNLKLVYTGGYASADAIPALVKMAAYIQLEREYGARRRAGKTIEAAAGFANSSEVLPEVASILSPYVRRLPYI